MSLGTQAPSRGKVLEFGQFVDLQIARTRTRIKTTDLATSGLTLLLGFLGLLFLEIVLDHLVGLPAPVRKALLILGLTVGFAYAMLKMVIPLLSKVNVLYAAKTIEQSDQSFKNSLINYLELKRDPSRISRTALLALESRAVADLADVEVDEVVNQGRLMNAFYALSATIVLFCLYAFLTPKSILDSTKRAFLADVVRPTNTKLVNIKPGTDPELAEVVAGANVDFGVDVQGVRPGRVVLHYSVDGGKFYALRDLAPGRHEFDPWQHTMPNVQQSMDYFLTAGDGESLVYHLNVLPAPTINEISHDLDFPEYTKTPDRAGVEGGIIEAIEGTKVTIHAVTNAPAKAATINMADQSVIPMDVEADQPTHLTGRFNVGKSGSYKISFRTTGGQFNPNPVVYDIIAIPDREPSAKFILPDKPVVKVPANVKVDLVMTGVDDHGVKDATLRVNLRDEVVLSKNVLEGKPASPQFQARETLDLATLNLKPGDKLEYKLSVRDNREPSPNRWDTIKQVIEIAAPVSPQEQKKQEAQRKKDLDQLAPPQELADSGEPQQPNDQPQDPQPQPNSGQQGAEENPSAAGGPGGKGTVDKQPGNAQPGADEQQNLDQQPQNPQQKPDLTPEQLRQIEQVMRDKGMLKPNEGKGTPPPSSKSGGSSTPSGKPQNGTTTGSNDTPNPGKPAGQRPRMDTGDQQKTGSQPQPRQPGRNDTTGSVAKGERGTQPPSTNGNQEGAPNPASPRTSPESVQRGTGDNTPNPQPKMGDAANPQTNKIEPQPPNPDARPGEAGKSGGESSDKPSQPAAADTAETGKTGQQKPSAGKPGEGKPGEGKPGEGKPGEGKPGEGKPGEGQAGTQKPGETGKPGEAKPGEQKPGAAKPGETGKPGEAKPGDGQAGEQKPGAAKPGEAKPGEQKPGETGKPGEAKPGDGQAGEQKPGETGKPGEARPGDGQPGEQKPGETGKPNANPAGTPNAPQKPGGQQGTSDRVNNPANPTPGQTDPNVPNQPHGDMKKGAAGATGEKPQNGEPGPAQAGEKPQSTEKAANPGEGGKTARPGDEQTNPANPTNTREGQPDQPKPEGGEPGSRKGAGDDTASSPTRPPKNPNEAGRPMPRNGENQEPGEPSNPADPPQTAPNSKPNTPRGGTGAAQSSNPKPEDQTEQGNGRSGEGQAGGTPRPGSQPPENPNTRNRQMAREGTGGQPNGHKPRTDAGTNARPGSPTGNQTSPRATGSDQPAGKNARPGGAPPPGAKPTSTEISSNPNMDKNNPQQGNPQQGNPQQGNPQQGNPQQGNPQQGNPQQGNPQQGNPQQGNPQQGKSDANESNQTQAEKSGQQRGGEMQGTPSSTQQAGSGGEKSSQQAGSGGEKQGNDSGSPGRGAKGGDTPSQGSSGSQAGGKQGSGSPSSSQGGGKSSGGSAQSQGGSASKPGGGSSSSGGGSPGGKPSGGSPSGGSNMQGGQPGGSNNSTSTDSNGGGGANPNGEGGRGKGHSDKPGPGPGDGPGNAPSAEGPENQFGGENLAPEGSPQSDLVLRKIPDLLKDDKAMKELEDRGFTRGQLEQFASKFKKAPALGPGRKGETIEAKPGEKNTDVKPTPGLPGIDPATRFSSKNQRARGSAAQDDVRGNLEGIRSQPPAEFRSKWNGYTSRLSRVAAPRATIAPKAAPATTTPAQGAGR